MGIDNIACNLEKFNLIDTLNKIVSSKSRKVVLLELMILIHSDNKFHRFEQSVIDTIANHYNISQNQLQIYSQWGKMASSLYQQGSLFIEDAH